MLPNMVIMVNMTMTMTMAYVTIVLAVEPLVVGEFPDNTSSTFPWWTHVRADGGAWNPDENVLKLKINILGMDF